MSTAPADYKLIPLIQGVTGATVSSWSPEPASRLISSFLDRLAIYASPLTQQRETMGLTHSEQAMFMRALWDSVTVVD
jgi:hypothetical protein